MQMQTHIGLLDFVTEMKLFFFNSFGVEYIPEEIKELVRNKNIKAILFRV